jgi:hypothetical protein
MGLHGSHAEDTGMPSQVQALFNVHECGEGLRINNL